LVGTFKYLDSKAEVWLNFLVGSSVVAAIIALAKLTRENAADPSRRSCGCRRL